MLISETANVISKINTVENGIIEISIADIVYFFPRFVTDSFKPICVLVNNHFQFQALYGKIFFQKEPIQGSFNISFQPYSNLPIMNWNSEAVVFGTL